MVDFLKMKNYLDILKNKTVFINYGDTLTFKETQELAKIIKEYKSTDVRKCFGEYIDDTKKLKYSLRCIKCNKISRLETGKDKLFENIKLFNKNLYVCNNCINKEKEEREILWKNKQIENEKYFISYFNMLIDPYSSWKNNVKIQEKIRDIENCMYYVDKQKRFELISILNYSDYLNTPYWKAIAEYKKRKNKNCQLCGSNINLNVHHTDYSILGNEFENLNKLTVLCKNCHYKYHNKENKNEV